MFIATFQVFFMIQPVLICWTGFVALKGTYYGSSYLLCILTSQMQLIQPSHVYVHTASHPHLLPSTQKRITKSRRTLFKSDAPRRRGGVESRRRANSLPFNLPIKAEKTPLIRALLYFNPVTDIPLRHQEHVSDFETEGHQVSPLM